MKCFLMDKLCEHPNNPTRGKVFVISPFEYPYEDFFTHGLITMFKELICKDIFGEHCNDEIFFDLNRADTKLQLGFVMCKRICQKIRESDYIIADITEPNRNVFYGLGLSFSFNKKIILVGRKPKDKPLTFGLVPENGSAYIEYGSLEDFDIQNKEQFENNKIRFIKALSKNRGTGQYCFHLLSGESELGSLGLSLSVSETIQARHKKLTKFVET